MTSKLHRQIVSGVALLPQYAGTRQKALEITLHSGPKGPTPSFQGFVLAFDLEGRLDLPAYTEGVAIAIEGKRPKPSGINVTDISPLIKHRRWHEQYTWSPDPKFIAKLTEDFRHGRLSAAPKLVASVTD